MFIIFLNQILVVFTIQVEPEFKVLQSIRRETLIHSAKLKRNNQSKYKGFNKNNKPHDEIRKKGC